MKVALSIITIYYGVVQNNIGAVPKQVHNIISFIEVRNTIACNNTAALK